MTNPKIKAVGILSASNEAGRTLSNSENNRRDEALRRDLAGYRLRQVQGRFGCVDNPLLSMVNPFLVANIEREIVVALGAKYHQFHVIFTEREGAGEGFAMRLELLEADWAARVVSVRKLFAQAHRRRRDLDQGYPGDRGRFFAVPVFDENTFDGVHSISSSEPLAPGSSAMSEPSNDPEHILAFCRVSKQGSLAAIHREARDAGVVISDEQIRRLILVPRAAEEPGFDLEIYKRHL